MSAQRELLLLSSQCGGFSYGYKKCDENGNEFWMMRCTKEASSVCFRSINQSITLLTMMFQTGQMMHHQNRQMIIICLIQNPSLNAPVATLQQ